MPTKYKLHSCRFKAALILSPMFHQWFIQIFHYKINGIWPIKIGLDHHGRLKIKIQSLQTNICKNRIAFSQILNAKSSQDYPNLQNL